MSELHEGKGRSYSAKDKYEAAVRKEAEEKEVAMKTQGKVEQRLGRKKNG